jgi:hypothetical protein
MNEEHLRFKLWKEKLNALQAQHARDDSDLPLASELWATSDGGPGNNLKSIPLAIAVFRGAALKSDSGVQALKHWPVPYGKCICWPASYRADRILRPNCIGR